MGEVITYFDEPEKISEIVSEWLLTSDETLLYGLEITPLD